MIELNPNSRFLFMYHIHQGLQPRKNGIGVYPKLMRKPFSFWRNVTCFENKHTDSSASDTVDMGNILICNKPFVSCIVTNHWRHDETIFELQLPDGGWLKKTGELH